MISEEQLFERSYNVCKEMLIQRGYTIKKCEARHIEAYDPNIQITIRVCFIIETHFNTKGMKDMINGLGGEDINHVIIVYPDIITPATKNMLTRSHDIIYELFTQQELQINITKHILQPTFEKVDDKTKHNLITKFGYAFPKLLQDKPISRFYYYRPGDIIRVIRSGENITYRIVAE